jgi:hypothetical protein
MITLDEKLPLEFAVDKVDASGSVVALDSTTLAALESVVVSGEVELGATTLAALENVVVSGEVELGATSLAALETISTIEGGFANWKATSHAASSTVGQIVATPLTGRVAITIQNLGSKDIFIGESNAVTVSTGIKIAKGVAFSEKLAAAANIWVICASGETASLRISEFAA